MDESVDPLDPDHVHDRASFLRFVAALAADRAESVAAEARSPSSPWGPAAGGWENGTIEDYLFAAQRWAEASDRLSDPWPVEPTWRGFARFLLAGKVYE